MEKGYLVGGKWGNAGRGRLGDKENILLQRVKKHKLELIWSRSNQVLLLTPS